MYENGRHYGVDSLGEEVELADDGYCEHGTYVGGCGADYMCGWCEDGISYKEMVEILTAQHRRAAQRHRDSVARTFTMLVNHMSFYDAMALVKRYHHVP